MPSRLSLPCAGGLSAPLVPRISSLPAEAASQTQPLPNTSADCLTKASWKLAKPWKSRSIAAASARRGVRSPPGFRLSQYWLWFQAWAAWLKIFWLPGSCADRTTTSSSGIPVGRALDEAVEGREIAGVVLAVVQLDRG